MNNIFPNGLCYFIANTSKRDHGFVIDSLEKTLHQYLNSFHEDPLHLFEDTVTLAFQVSPFRREVFLIGRDDSDWGSLRNSILEEGDAF